MVESLVQPELSHRAPLKLPAVVEIVGPAGVGKSTLTATLCRQQPQAVDQVSCRRLGSLPGLSRHVLSLLPAFAGTMGRSRFFNREELRGMIYLSEWHRSLTLPGARHPPLTVLDHGPIFRLVYLREFGPAATQTPRFHAWWQTMLERWAGVLDRIIWLDAPDEVLKHRIRSRKHRSHRFKQMSETEANTFLTGYRRSYDHAMAELARLGGPRVDRFNSNRYSPEEIAEQILTQ